MPRRTTSQTPVFFFPVHGSEESQPITPEQAERERVAMEDAIRRHWNNPGVRAIIQLVEREAAISLMRSALPVVQGSREHAAGGAHSLQQFVAKVQNLRITKKGR